MERFGPFELERRIGVGGMAETFEAVRRGPGSFEQRVCVKRILPAWQEDPRYVAMFLEEARIAARMRHTTIVQVVEAGEAEGVPYLALELIEGTDLRRLIDRHGALPADLVALFASDLATALEIAHRNRVLHRDVSPSNVLISLAGEIKLADFGIAKAHDGMLRTSTGVPKGKAAYMAPEYAATARASAATDVYALGVTLFEVATSRKPPRGGGQALRELRPDLPRALADAIVRALEPDPARRFACADAMFDSLDPTPVSGARRRLGSMVREIHDPVTALDRTEVSARPSGEPTRPSRPRGATPPRSP